MKVYGSRYIGKCECGGKVRGVSEFGRLWTWCDTCTPVVTINIPPIARDKALLAGKEG